MFNWLWQDNGEKESQKKPSPNGHPCRQKKTGRRNKRNKIDSPGSTGDIQREIQQKSEPAVTNLLAYAFGLIGVLFTVTLARRGAPGL